MARSDVGVWMKFFPADWLSSTRPLSAAAKGIYIDLLAYGWDNRLPDDPAALARIAGVEMSEFAEVWDSKLRRKFESDGEGGIVNPRQEQIRRDQAKLRADGRERQRRYRERHSDRYTDRQTGEGSGSGSGIRSQDQGQAPRGVRGGPAADAAPQRRKRRRGITPDELRALADEAAVGSLGLEALQRWHAYRAAIGKTLVHSTWVMLVKQASRDQREFAAKVRNSIQNGYQGLVSPDDDRGPKKHDAIAEANEIIRSMRQREIE